MFVSVTLLVIAGWDEGSLTLQVAKMRDWKTNREI